MDIITSMRVFTTVVHTGSFARAAEKLDLSRGMASRYVAKLEKHLGSRLLNRTTRKLSLTEVGADYHDRALHILALLEEADSSADQGTSTLRGTLRIATSVGLGVLGMGQLMADFMNLYPELKVDLVLNDRRVDLVEEGFDVAIRMGPRVDPGLIARKIADVQIVVCASRSYLDKHGVPEKPHDLARHHCLTYSYSSQEREWPFARDGMDALVQVSGRFRANNGNVLVNAAIAGLGITRQPIHLISGALQRQQLVKVLPTWDAGKHAIYAVYSSRRFLPKKVRALNEYLLERFGSASPWNASIGEAQVRQGPTAG